MSKQVYTWSKAAVFFKLISVTFVVCLGMLYLQDEMVGSVGLIWKFEPELHLNPTYVLKEDKGHSMHKTETKHYDITWYRFSGYMSRFPDAVKAGFKVCEYNNCRMRFQTKYISISDAVIFDGRKLRANDIFKKNAGQVWIFSAHEAPIRLKEMGAFWARGDWVSAFNWTMTYDKSNTDIHLPYGEIVRKTDELESKDYKEIFRKKKAMALIVVSHCKTHGRRELYVKTLSKYLNIDIFGDCGRQWNCGKKFEHDSCFDIVKNYMFYLAFENSLCNQYFTEKLYRNYNYDTIMVVRGGRNGDAKRLLPNGTYISTDDFDSFEDLADYMNKLAGSEKLYTEMLKRKDRFYSLPYKTLYQRAMCDLCERMNHQDKYRKHIKSTVQWAYGKKQCEKPSNISDLNDT